MPPSSAAPLKETARRLARANRRALVAALSPVARCALETALAERVTDALAARFSTLSGLCIASYQACGSEIDPSLLNKSLQEAGAVLVWPQVQGETLVFQTAPGEQRRPLVVLTPLLAADAQGTRLGQGGGHYDRALAALRHQGTPWVIGLAWEISAPLPREAHDQPLDALATPTLFLVPKGFSS